MKAQKITRRRNEYVNGRDWYYGDMKVGRSIGVEGYAGTHHFDAVDGWRSSLTTMNQYFDSYEPEGLAEIQQALETAAADGVFAAGPDQAEIDEEMERVRRYG